MIDFILLVFVLTMAYAGFWLGAKYGSLKALGAAVKAKLSSMFTNQEGE